MGPVCPLLRQADGGVSGLDEGGFVEVFAGALLSGGIKLDLFLEFVEVEAYSRIAVHEVVEGADVGAAFFASFVDLVLLAFVEACFLDVVDRRKAEAERVPAFVLEHAAVDQVASDVSLPVGWDPQALLDVPLGEGSLGAPVDLVVGEFKVLLRGLLGVGHCAARARGRHAMNVVPPKVLRSLCHRTVFGGWLQPRPRKGNPMTCSAERESTQGSLERWGFAGFKETFPLPLDAMKAKQATPQLERIVAFDLETTGLDPKEDRIVEFAFILLDTEMEELDRWTDIVNPGRPIPREAANVHGITDEDVTGAPAFGHVAPLVQRLVDDAVLMAYNHEFDIPFLDAELKRAGGPGLPPKTPAIDPMIHFKRYHPDTSNRLEHAVQHYLDTPLDGAHRAIHDTQAMVDVFKAMCRVHPPLSTSLADALVEPKEWIDDDRKLYADDDGTIRYGFGKHEGEPVRKHTSYAEWMLTSDFPEETKARLREILQD